jgi:site-specific recombinase XerD
MPKPRNTANYKFSEISLRLFGDHLVQFRQYLSEQTYAENTIGSYLGGANMLARLMEAEGVSLRDLDEAQAVNLVARTGWHSRRKSFGTMIVRRFVRFLNEQGIVKPTLPPTINEDARAKLRRNYETYLRRQRGLADRTIHEYWRFADRFLKFRFGEEIGDLSQVRSTDIVRFLQESAACKRPFPLRVKSYAPNIRSFFR